MGKLVVLAFVSMDGVMQAPGGPQEDVTDGFSHGGWTVGYWDEVLNTVMGEQMGRPYDLLLGGKTYEIFAAHWPKITDPAESGGLNEARKYVASRTLKAADWQNSVILKGDVAEEVGKLKAMAGPESQVHGSSDLIQTLLKHDLVDELRLKVFPVTLGAGKRLFGHGAIPAGWRLLDSGVSTTGVIVASYARDGHIRTGSFALEE